LEYLRWKHFCEKFPKLDADLLNVLGILNYIVSYQQLGKILTIQGEE
jgi:hypothetical protein